VTDGQVWRGAFNFLADLADKPPGPADYAIKVRQLYDVLLQETSDPAEVREFILFHIAAHQHHGQISEKHRDLVLKLLPEPPRRGRGRPKGALGNTAHDKRHQLYSDWIGESTLSPSLTKEQFAQSRLGISDRELAGPYELDHRAKMDALLQDLKPARMKQLDEGQRRAIETIYPLTLKYPELLARSWREAKQQCRSLTKKQFLRDYFGWPRRRKLRPIEAEMIDDYLEKLDEGEQQLLSSERPK
jgi:hypothetical protein